MPVPPVMKPTTFPSRSWVISVTPFGAVHGLVHQCQESFAQRGQEPLVQAADVQSGNLAVTFPRNHSGAAAL